MADNGNQVDLTSSWSEYHMARSSKNVPDSMYSIQEQRICSPTSHNFIRRLWRRCSDESQEWIDAIETISGGQERGYSRGRRTQMVTGGRNMIGVSDESRSSADAGLCVVWKFTAIDRVTKSSVESRETYSG